MLAYKPEERVSAIDAYANPWVHCKEFAEMNDTKTKELMCNMGKFVVIKIIFPQ